MLKREEELEKFNVLYNVKQFLDSDLVEKLHQYLNINKDCEELDEKMTKKLYIPNILIVMLLIFSIFGAGLGAVIWFIVVIFNLRVPKYNMFLKMSKQSWNKKIWSFLLGYDYRNWKHLIQYNSANKEKLIEQLSEDHNKKMFAQLYDIFEKQNDEDGIHSVADIIDFFIKGDKIKAFETFHGSFDKIKEKLSNIIKLQNVSLFSKQLLNNKKTSHSYDIDNQKKAIYSLLKKEKISKDYL